MLSGQQQEEEDEGPFVWEDDALRSVTGLGYEIVGQCIHRGHSAAVWHAIALGLHRKVVIKMIDFRMMCKRSIASELAVGLACAHRNVAPTVAWHWLDLGDDGDVCVVVMDNDDDYRELSAFVYADEHSYTARPEWMAHDPLVRLDLFRQLLTGVAHLHDVLGVAHRDIKSGNIVVTQDLTRLRIVDFGFALFLDNTRPAPVPEHLRAMAAQHPLGDRWWQDGVMRAHMLRGFHRAGTLGYMAPELLCSRGGADPCRADMYSVGVVMYEMFYGSEPWGDGHFYADLWRAPPPTTALDDEHWRQFDAKYPLRKPDGVEPAVWAVIEALMQSNPNRRPTAAQALGMLV